MKSGVRVSALTRLLAEAPPMKRNSPVLDPYCLHCGKYKGVGYCSDSTCKGALVPEYSGELIAGSRIISSQRMQSPSCRVCRGPASIECRRCGSGYCEQHAGNASESVMSGLKHHIGICIICHELVCEDCWILDENEHITCLDHLEEE